MLVSELHGVGKKTSALLKKLKIETVDDLLTHYPRRYEEHPAPKEMADLRDGERCAVRAVMKYPVSIGNNGSSSLYLTDGTGFVTCRWFHNPYIGKILKYGIEYVFLGTVSEWHGKYSILQPEFVEAEKYQKMIGVLSPVYPLTKGISNESMFRYMLQAIYSMPEPEDPLPEAVRIKYGLISKGDAVRCIHYPANGEVLEMARTRLVFDEFYGMIYRLRAKSEERGYNYFRIHRSPTMQKILQELPYSLTESQKNAVRDIKADFEKDLVANRLVQGDVGSGKTLVALLAMVIMADNGFQSVLMAPTEVLASQHYQELCRLLEKTGEKENFAPVLLTGSTKEKKSVYEKIASGKSRIVIGTHAVIQGKVAYHDLALAVIDEQHRFGVEQRDALSKKGKRPVHTIIMTATPIPHTTGKILFGAMDCSIMKDKPAERLPVKSCVITKEHIPAVYRLMERQMSNGHQVYVICPMVDGDDDGKKSVEQTSKTLRGVFPDTGISIMHGKMDAKQKQESMDAFAGGETQIMVATTVVEVGVNVPNATVIVIEGANNFGMLQLHQLRGRVGRGKDQSYCVFLNASGKDSEKLNVLAGTNDGFQIAEADYRIRKAGNLLGTRQSGDMGFKLADIVKDEQILKQAEKAVLEQMRIS